MRRVVIRGPRVAAIRRDRGLTLAELAFAIGRSASTIVNWESRGSVEIRYSDACQCARALRCSMKDLAAALDAPLPAAPGKWQRMRRQLKLRRRQAKCERAIATGQPPRWARRFAAILGQRPTHTPLFRRSDLGGALNR